ncbi:hypothetical protein LCGC14_2520240 [marine sediment metagenome]|uniref:Uncharacterized protein n=1 Tax=marine sediment metagenome TaxID=412755 RepID=A0A0F9AX21_9ZZZZ
MAIYEISTTEQGEATLKELTESGIGTALDGSEPLTNQELLQHICNKYLVNKGDVIRQRKLRNVTDEELTSLEAERTR